MEIMYICKIIYINFATYIMYIILLMTTNTFLFLGKMC